VAENASPDEVAQRQARARQALDKRRAAATFATLAREYSDAPTGRTVPAGLRPADRYPELFVNAVRQAAVGDVVGPLRSPAGFHVLKVWTRPRRRAHGGVQNHARHILLRVGAG
jgi:peptidyl-prolyl cis-trans isomerase SurA